MKRAVPYLSKFVFEIIPGALVSVVAAYFLSMLHLARGAEPPAADPPTVVTIQNDGLSADERRELTRQMLKERRENPEQPAEVKPVPSLRPTAPATETADLTPQVVAPQVVAPQVVAPQVVAPQVVDPQLVAPQATAPQATAPQVIVPEPKPRAEPEARPRPEASRPAVAAVTPVPPPLPRAAAPRMRPEPAQGAAPASPPAAAVTAAAPAGAPVAVPGTPLPPVTVNTTPADAPVEPPRRSFVGSVFSSFSSIAGGAANVTGNTVNWVIDLPGKAISAGGRLLSGSPAPAPTPVPAPAAAPAPTAAPAAAPTVDPQRRNL
jgi:hypothetical protein